MPVRPFLGGSPCNKLPWIWKIHGFPKNLRQTVNVCGETLLLESILHTSSITQSDPFTLNVGACRCPNISWLRGSFFQWPRPSVVRTFATWSACGESRFQKSSGNQMDWSAAKGWCLGSLPPLLHEGSGQLPSPSHSSFPIPGGAGLWILDDVASYKMPSHATPQPLEMVQKHTETVCTLWLFNIAMENGPFIDGLPINNS